MALTRDTPGALKWQRGDSGRPMASEVENDAIRRYQEGDPRALDGLLRAYQSHIKRLCARVSGGELEDKMQAATIGTIQAAKRFDPLRGVLFWTYASWFALAFAQRESKQSRKFVVLPQTVGTRSIVNKIPGLAAKFYAQTGEQLSAEDAAELTAHSVADARKVLEPPRAVSIEVLSEAGVELHADVESADLVAERSERREILSSVISSLTRQEREVVHRRCLKEGGMTLAEVGKEMGVSRERVRQLQVNATKKLKKKFEAAEAAEDYN